MAEKTTLRRIVVGAGGALGLVALFLPWAEVGGREQNGWELWTGADFLVVVLAAAAFAVALTGGRIGLFRADVSIIGAADLLGIVTSGLIVWLLASEVPAGASVEAGPWLALVAALTVAFGAADYSTLRGAPVFPRLGETRATDLRN